MMNSTTQYPFTFMNVNTAPNGRGVYFLYHGEELTYIGKSITTVRERLQSHLAGREGPCTESATSFSTMAALSPIEAEKKLLQEFEATHGRLPRCNDVMPG
tara:strand:+ start:7035 stop:7337 length:303 start_codon:yes stop_codon:yes gene_type:complete